METSSTSGQASGSQQVQFTLSKEQIFAAGMACGVVLALAYLWILA